VAAEVEAPLVAQLQVVLEVAEQIRLEPEQLYKVITVAPVEAQEVQPAAGAVPAQSVVMLVVVVELILLGV
jgi:hypothetical protein